MVYRLYKCIYARRQHLRASYKEPPSPHSSNPLMSTAQNSGPYMSQIAYTNYHPSVYARMGSHYSTSTMGFDGGKSDLTLPQAYGSTRSLNTPGHKASESSSSGFNQQMRTESFGSVMDQSGLVPKREGSASGSSGESWPPSPNTAAFSDGISRSTTPSNGVTSPALAYTAGTLQRPGVRGDSSMSTDRLRAQGSRSSLLYPNNQHAHSGRDRMSLAHAYTSSSVSVASQRSSGHSQGGYLAPAQPRQPRLPGPPHARHSRVEIVPPMPLAPPPGTVVATDKATLAFSSLSGIGSGKALFGSNMHLAAASGAEEPRQRDSGLRQHRRQATAQTAKTNSSNGSGDDGSSMNATPWFSTPPGTTSEDHVSARRDGSSNGSRGTLYTPSEELEGPPIESSTAAQDVMMRIASPARNSSLAGTESQSPLDKLKVDLQQVASRTSQTQ